MPLVVVRNDITKIKADAIVNPANTHLMEGSGTSYAIHKAAGEQQLFDAAQEIGYCGVGKSVITPGFKLSKYVIHTVGPYYVDGHESELKLLRESYTSALEVAKANGCESIAFPLLSSGNYGFPVDIALKCALRSIQEFLFENDMKVYLVVYDEVSTNYAKKLFNNVVEDIDDEYVLDNDEDLAGDEFYALFVESERHKIRHNRAGRAINVGPSTMPSERPSWMLDAKPKKEQTLDEQLKIKSESFSDMLLRLIDERGLKDSVVYKKAQISKQNFNKIKNIEGYTPKKNTVYALCLALELTWDETEELLSKVGYGYSDNSKTDIIVKYYIEHEYYSVFDINYTLEEYHLPVLALQ